MNLIKPGEHVDQKMRTENRIGYEVWRNQNNIQKLDSMCLSCDTNNAALLSKAIKREKDYESNEWVADKLNKRKQLKETGPLQPLVDVVPQNIFKALADMSMIQIIFFAVFFGIILISLPKEKRDPVYNLIDGLNEVFVKMVWTVMRAMPIFVFALMAGQIVKTLGTDQEKFVELLSFLLKYSLTVVLGLAIMILIVYQQWSILTKIKYKFFMSGIQDAQITAFSNKFFNCNSTCNYGLYSKQFKSSKVNCQFCSANWSHGKYG
ncbi:MAG: cation:dicarboxylase symporter family transporter [Bacteroidia bacterium]